MAPPHLESSSHNDKGYVPVLIIGAGASGISMGHQLKTKMGFEHFRIVDRLPGLGGGWWSNRYPGVACDVPSASYSFSFAPHFESPHLYPTGSEFRTYLQRVADRYQLGSHMEFNIDVAELRWIEADTEWEATLHHLAPGVGELSARDRQELVERVGTDSVYVKKERIRAKIIVSCAGILVEPNPWPSSIPGRDTFQGDVFHTARWRNEVDLNGKDVVVIGAGSSAAQVVPSLLKEPYKVKSLTQIMRAAPWVMPRLEEPFGKEKFAKYAPTVLHYLPFIGWLYRLGIHFVVEVVWFMLLQDKHAKWRRGMEKATLERTYQLIPEKYHKIMTPDYPYGCKRRVFDSDWLGSMNKPNFTLTDRKIISVNSDHITLGASNSSGGNDSAGVAEQQIHADVIVLANGFEGTRYLQPITVLGRNGIDLHDLWRERGGPQAYLGAAVDGFPNFFMSLGPNTANNTASMILTIENITGYIANIIKPVLGGEVAVAEVKRSAVERWKDEIQGRLQRTVFLACTSWFMDENRYISTLYAGSQTGLTFRCMFPCYEDWIFVSKTGRELKRGRGRWAWPLVAFSLVVAAGGLLIRM